MLFCNGFSVCWNIPESKQHSTCGLVKQIVLDTGSSLTFLFPKDVKSCQAASEPMDASCSPTCSNPHQCASELQLPQQHMPDQLEQYAFHNTFLHTQCSKFQICTNVL